MSQDTETAKGAIGPLPTARPRRPRRQLAAVAALVGAAAVGAGVTAVAHRGPSITLVALTPAPISAMKNGNAVAVKGQVAEVFGNKFILSDGNGRALIETGRKGEGGTLVTPAETVTVQGRFENGFVRAVAIQHDDGRTVMLDPPAPPPPPRPPLG